MTQITVDRAVLYLAIDALEIYGAKAPAVKETIDALRAALEAKQEPDYWRAEAERYAGNADYWRKRCLAAENRTATPQDVQRKPLTDEQIGAGKKLVDPDGYDLCGWSFRKGVLYAEAAHGITAHTIETDPAKIRAAFEEDDFQAGAV